MQAWLQNRAEGSRAPGWADLAARAPSRPPILPRAPPPPLAPPPHLTGSCARTALHVAGSWLVGARSACRHCAMPTPLSQAATPHSLAMRRARYPTGKMHFSLWKAGCSHSTSPSSSTARGQRAGFFAPQRLPACPQVWPTYSAAGPCICFHIMSAAQQHDLPDRPAKEGRRTLQVLVDLKWEPRKGQGGL